MPNWMFKAAVQGVVSFLPKGHLWHYLLQKYAQMFLPVYVGSVNLTPGAFEHKLKQCRCHIESYLAGLHAHGTTDNGTQAILYDYPRPVLHHIPRNGLAGYSPSLCHKSLPELSVMELGTGLHPVISVGLYICGASRILTIDRIPLLRSDSVREVFRFFVKYAEAGKLADFLPYPREDRIGVLRRLLQRRTDLDPNDCLKELNIHTIVRDARHTRLKDNSIDFFVSNNTLEHIPREILQSIFLEFRRLASHSAVMSHYIDMVDHYWYFDKSLSCFNFRRYPHHIWRLFNNSLFYQNRLCISDYLNIHSNAGFKIAYRFTEIGSTEDLDRLRIATDFAHYSLDELLVTCSWIVSVHNHSE